MLTWVRDYGQLWREGSDMANFHAKNPDTPRFKSVLWNYAYNLPLGRFQKPGNWNDADFIIGGDGGMSLAESRSQMALWSMMSAPLILSSDVGKLSPEAIAILGNQAVIAIDQDRAGPDGHPGAAQRDRGYSVQAAAGRRLRGCRAQSRRRGGRCSDSSRRTGVCCERCRLDAENLWSGERQSGMLVLQGNVEPTTLRSGASTPALRAARRHEPAQL